MTSQMDGLNRIGRRERVVSKKRYTKVGNGKNNHQFMNEMCRNISRRFK